jgi:hypothetical protein
MSTAAEERMPVAIEMLTSVQGGGPQQSTPVSSNARLDNPKRLEEKRFNVSRNREHCGYGWMKDDRRRRDDFRFKHQDVQIVVEMWSSTAMSRPTKHAGMTLAIVTHPADVLVRGCCEKNIGGRVHALGTALKAATDSRTRVEIDILCDRYEKIRILWMALFCCQRPDEGDPVHAPKGACSEGKLEDRPHN